MKALPARRTSPGKITGLLCLAAIALQPLTAQQVSKNQIQQTRADEQDVQQHTAAIVNQISALIDELAANGISGDDLKVLKSTKAALTNLSGPEMERVISSLKQAADDTNAASSQQKVVSAYAGQKGIILQFRQILHDYEQRTAAAELPVRFKQLAERQTQTLLTSANVARQTAGKSAAELTSMQQTTQQIVQADQSAIANEVSVAKDELAKAAANSSDTDGAALKKAQQDMSTGVLEKALAGANESLSAGQLIKALKDQQTARDELRKIANDLNPPTNAVDALAANTAAIQKLIDGQKALLKQTADAAAADAKARKTGLDDKQGALVDQTNIVQQDMQSLDPTTAGIVKDAINPMQASRAALTRGGPEAYNKSTTSQQEAIDKLEEALKQSQQALADAQKAADAAQKDPVAQLQELQKQIQQAQQDQKQVTAQTQQAASNSDPNATQQAQQAQSQLQQQAAAMQQTAQPLSLAASQALAQASQAMQQAAQATQNAQQAQQNAQQAQQTAQTQQQNGNQQAAQQAQQQAQQAQQQAQQAGQQAQQAQQQAQQALAQANQQVAQAIAQNQQQQADPQALAQAANALQDAQNQVSTAITAATPQGAQQGAQQQGAQQQAPPTMAQAQQALAQAAKDTQAAATTPGLPQAAAQAVQQAQQAIAQGQQNAAKGDAKGTANAAQNAEQALAQAQAAVAMAQAGMNANSPQMAANGQQQQQGQPNGPPMPNAPSGPDNAKGMPPGSNQKGTLHNSPSGNGKFVTVASRDRAAIDQTQSEKRPQEFAPMIDQYMKNLADQSSASP